MTAKKAYGLGRGPLHHLESVQRSGRQLASGCTS